MTKKTEDYGIYIVDDLLEESEANLVFELARAQIYKDYESFFSFFRPSISSGYRIFKQEEPFETHADVNNPLKRIPSGTPIDTIIQNSLKLLHFDLITSNVTCYFVIMTNGSHHSFHIDSSYKAAFIYYLDTEWNPNNGGELIIYPDLNISHDDFRLALMGKKIVQNRFWGVDGLAVAPLFNRLVAFRTGIPHKVSKVEGYSGIGRISLTGFIR
ncbi:hypothetical protein Xbed_00621 [Xenorhabdus beddingii]|uniref:Prolyl 4-hydroxylase alpha subunit Fe(2+) 2OG dioxygenase domain-containing protein n=1 Tax=Xenorhabdus beddingii TaxID=40578 RepID=A0A1Y2SRD9_9GAMM|nr:2OG-Fe(II) oxygenase [Xenorhabdus beddingii]OTA21392.1 hypothetical protein Xbed_00621 [Xenorhabdus beddingii]